MDAQPWGEGTHETITVRNNGRWYVAIDESTGVASQGKTKASALAKLADALQLHTRPEPADGEDDRSDTPDLLS